MIDIHSYRELWLAVLNRAFNDAKWRLHNDKDFGVKVWGRDTNHLKWFFDDDESIGSLNWICNELDFFDRKTIAERVLQLNITNSLKYESIIDYFNQKGTQNER